MQVKIDDIIVEDRYRRDFGDILELAESIRKQGLICPIALETLPGNKYKLLAGERRLKACQILGFSSIEARIYDEGLPELRARQIELEENIMRKDFSYIEECNLKKNIHFLRQQIHGVKTSTLPDAPGWSMRDTGRLLDVSHAEVSRDIKLATVMEDFPDIDWGQFKTKHEAQKYVKSLSNVLARQDLAEQFEKKTVGSTSFVRQMADSYICGDFLELGQKLPDEFADFVEIDPPYAIDLQTAKRSSASPSLEVYTEIDKALYQDFLQKTFTICHRVMKPNSWLICWFGPEPWFEVVYQLLAQNFRVKRMPAIWAKTHGQSKSPTTTLASGYEMFFYARKGDAELAWPGRSNMFYVGSVHHEKKRHPTERPALLMQDVIKTFSLENAQILVPFAGSGRTLLEAFKLKRHAIGYDIVETYRNAYLEALTEEFKI